MQPPVHSAECTRNYTRGLNEELLIAVIGCTAVGIRNKTFKKYNKFLDVYRGFCRIGFFKLSGLKPFPLHGNLELLCDT